MLTEWGRKNLKGLFEAVARVLQALHLTPNAITLIGTSLSLVVAYFILTDRLLIAGVVYFISSITDALDGTLARMAGVRNRFGAFWDSTLDRLSEAIVVSSIAFWAALQGNMTGLAIALAALVTSFMVSYTRARGEGLGIESKVGFGTRVERFIILLIALLVGYPIVGLAIIAVLAGITTVMRIYDVWRQTSAT